MDRRHMLALLTAAVAGVSCTDEPKRTPAKPTSQAAKPTSRAASKTPAADLRKTADDPRADRADRATAVFALFANYLKLPCGPIAAGEALGDAKWLTAATVHPIYVLTGVVPVKFGGDATVYSLHVQPDKDGRSDYVIYLRLSGGSDQSADDLRAFLRGGKGLKGKPELVEFALCYPGQSPIERFGTKGLTAMDND